MKQKNRPIVPWRLSRRNYNMAKALGHVLEAAVPFSEEYEVALDELKSIPGFPMGYGGPMENGILQIEVIDMPTVSVH